MESILVHEPSIFGYMHVFFNISGTHRVEDKGVDRVEVIGLQEVGSVGGGRRRSDRRRSNDFVSLTISIDDIGLVATLYDTAGRALWGLLLSLSLAAFNITSLLSF